MGEKDDKDVKSVGKEEKLSDESSDAEKLDHLKLTKDGDLIPDDTADSNSDKNKPKAPAKPKTDSKVESKNIKSDNTANKSDTDKQKPNAKPAADTAPDFEKVPNPPPAPDA